MRHCLVCVALCTAWGREGQLCAHSHILSATYLCVIVVAAAGGRLKSQRQPKGVNQRMRESLLPVCVCVCVRVGLVVRASEDKGHAYTLKATLA